MKALEWYASLAVRERKLVLWGVIGAAAVVLIFGILWPLHAAVTGARHRVKQQSDDLVWMRAHALEVRTAAAAMSGAGESLVVIIDRSARELGLAEAIKSTTPTNTNGTRVELAAVSFDMLAGWLARLQDQFGVTVVTATVEAAGAAGLVNASLELSRPGS